MLIQLTALDFLYLSLAIGVILFTAFFILLVVRILKFLETFRFMTMMLADIVRDLGSVKNRASAGLLKLFGNIIGSLIGRRR